jgi:hypothetical protein
VVSSVHTAHVAWLLIDVVQVAAALYVVEAALQAYSGVDHRNCSTMQAVHASIVDLGCDCELYLEL